MVLVELAYALIGVYVRLCQWERVLEHSIHLRNSHILLPSSKARLLLLSGRAHQALGRPEAAFRDVCFAENLAPEDPAVAVEGDRFCTQIMRDCPLSEANVKNIDAIIVKWQETFDKIMRETDATRRWVQIHPDGQVQLRGPPDAWVRAKGLEDEYGLHGLN